MAVNSTIAYAGAAFAVLLATPYMLPGSVTVEREAVIQAEPRAIYQLLESNRGFQAFNPWKDDDPNLRITLTGPHAGVGSAFAFKGESGEGVQTIIEAEPERSVVTEIDLGPMGKPVQSFTLEPTDEGVRVIWSTEATFGLNPIGRVMGVFMDGRLGPIYERGLKNLAAAV